MAFQNKYYNLAINIIRENKKYAQKEYENKLNELYTAIPQLKSIEDELSALGAKAMKAAMLGKTDELKAIETVSKELQNKKSEIQKSANLKLPSPNCKKCNDTGYNGTHLCECVLTKAKELVFKDLSLKTPIHNQTFSTFNLDYYEKELKKEMTDIFNFAKKYADNFSLKSPNLLISGNTGLGKTHISMAIINTVIGKGYGVIYDSAQNLFTQIEKEHFSYSGSTEKIDAILTCDLLVIDDLGTEFSTTFTNSQFYNIINTRINNNLPTIINTNLDVDAIEKAYTPRILSRIIGHYKNLAFKGSDIRIKKALEK